MYVRLCSIEILSSYIKEISVGDTLTVRALVTNPLDWQHFYEMLSSLRKGDKTDFTVVTSEGDRIVGEGEVSGFEKWSDMGRYGFMIKVSVRRQKSLTDRRIRGSSRKPLAEEIIVEQRDRRAKSSSPSRMQPRTAATETTVTASDMLDFKELFEGSLTMDMSA